MDLLLRRPLVCLFGSPFVGLSGVEKALASVGKRSRDATLLFLVFMCECVGNGIIILYGAFNCKFMFVITNRLTGKSMCIFPKNVAEEKVLHNAENEFCP